MSALRDALPDPATRQALRRASGLTLREVAAAVGVSHTTIARYESGERGVGKRHLRAYVEVLLRLTGEIEQRAAVIGAGPLGDSGAPTGART